MIISNKLNEFIKAARVAAEKREELEKAIEYDYCRLNNLTAYRTVLVALEDDIYSICDTTGDLDDRLDYLKGLGVALDAEFMNKDMPTPFDRHTAEQIVVVARAESDKEVLMASVRDLDPGTHTAKQMLDISRQRGEDEDNARYKKLVEENNG